LASLQSVEPTKVQNSGGGVVVVECLLEIVRGEG